MVSKQGTSEFSTSWLDYQKDNQEADIVDALRSNGAALLSLVATLGGQVTYEWDVPDDVFMVLVLDPKRMQGVSGLAKYRSEFSSVA